LRKAKKRIFNINSQLQKCEPILATVDVEKKIEKAKKIAIFKSWTVFYDVYLSKVINLPEQMLKHIVTNLIVTTAFTFAHN
jgi:hypothetical protein